MYITWNDCQHLRFVQTTIFGEFEHSMSQRYRPSGLKKSQVFRIALELKHWAILEVPLKFLPQMFICLHLIGTIALVPTLYRNYAQFSTIIPNYAFGFVAGRYMFCDEFKIFMLPLQTLCCMQNTTMIDHTITILVIRVFVRRGLPGKVNHLKQFSTFEIHINFNLLVLLRI